MVTGGLCLTCPCIKKYVKPAAHQQNTRKTNIITVNYPVKEGYSYAREVHTILFILLYNNNYYII